MAALMRQYPLTTSMSMYAVIWTASDICQQKLISKAHRINYRRTLKTALIGSFYIAPAVSIWVRFLSRRIPVNNLIGVGKKIMCDQLIFAPCVSSGFYGISHIIQDGNYNPGDIMDEIIDKVPKTWIFSVPFWSTVGAFNFGFVPLHYRLYIMCLASFFWANFLCYMKERPYHHHHFEHGHIVTEELLVVPPK